jgi:serine/threonine protein kinase/tetratricopeptide (TPR) repeat protein
MAQHDITSKIDALCRDFRRKCRSGDHPRIEEYLESIEQGAVALLFRSLLNLDIEHRRRQKHNPSSDDYIRRFPQFAAIVRQAFFESTRMSLDADVGTPADDADSPSIAPTLDLPSANRIGEYVLLDELGRGGFGVVYKARHQQRQDLVALKTLPNWSGDHQLAHAAERLHRFRREFRSLSSINHPNLVGMQSLEVAGDQWFLTMDLVEGVDFLDYVRPSGQLNEVRLRSALRQVATGIIELHRRGIVHRDLKPSNVLISQTGQVVILDFGLVAQLQEAGDHTASLRSAQFAGTPGYAAPEQMFGTRNAASDWYALGTMIYEALTGKLPFQGLPMEILSRKQNDDPPQLFGRRDISADLAELVDDLLRRVPTLRIDSDEIARRLKLDDTTRGGQTSDDSEGSPTLSMSQGDQILIGREQQLAQLEAVKRELLNSRQPQVAFISGLSGEGKTALAENFLAPLRCDDRILVLSGRCYDRETVPFKAIDCLIEAMVTYLRARRIDQIQGWLPDDIEMLAHLFPLLRRVSPIADRCGTRRLTLDSKQIRYRAFTALRKLLVNISHTTRIVLFVDDLQWADADSAEVMFRLLQPPDAPAALFLGSYRRDEADDSPFLNEWNSQCQSNPNAIAGTSVSVQPLNPDQCLMLVALGVGIDPQRLKEQAAELFRDTHGNPYLVEQLVEGFDPATGGFRAIPLNEIIDTKLRRLPADAERLLNIIAVAGKAVSLADTSRVIGQNKPAYGTVTHMRSERLVRLIRAEDRELVDTYHDKIREAVLTRMEMGSRRQLHRAIGETIEARESIDGEAILRQLAQREPLPLLSASVFDLAYHFKQADDANKSLAYAILAAEQAQAQFALPAAIEHFHAAERKLTGANQAIQYRTKFGLGSALVLAGQYEAANVKLDEAIAAAPDKIDAIRAKLQQADIVYKTGLLRKSMAMCEQLLAELGLPVPATRFGKWLDPIKVRLMARLRKLAGKPEKTESALAIQILCLYSFPCLMCDRSSMLWATAIATDLATHAGDSRLRGLAAAVHSHASSHFRSDLRRAMREAKLAKAIGDELSDVNLQGLAIYLVSAGMLFHGNFEESLAGLREAISKFASVGDVWRKSFAEAHLAISLSRLGHLADAQRLARRVFLLAVKFRQQRIAQGAFLSWVDATDGEGPTPEEMASFVPVEDDLAATAVSSAAESQQWLRRGDLTAALRAAEDAVRRASRLYSPMGVPSVSFPTYAQALREQALACEARGPAEAREFRRQALQAARKAVRITRRQPFALPYALRELALNYLLAGKLRRAYKSIRESCAVAENQQARFEYAKSLLVCGQIAEKLGRLEAQRQIADAQARLSAFQQEIDAVRRESLRP